MVVLLLVDDGDPSRGHRDNLFEPRFHQAGIACGPHKSYRSACVIDFATELIEKPAAKEPRQNDPARATPQEGVPHGHDE